MAGFDLNEGKYDKSVCSVQDIRNTFSKFFEMETKKESTYKYALMKSILDCINTASDKSYKITFDSLFCRFSEIYWVLVFRYKIPQKAPSINTPETHAEKIVREIASKYKLKKKMAFSDLPNTVRYDLMTQMKKKCSKYVFGALYAETDYLFYSFSKDKQWIKVNPLVAEYIKKHSNSFQKQNYQAWAKFYTDIVVLSKDETYYRRLLKREFGDNVVLLCSNPKTSVKKVVITKNTSKHMSDLKDTAIAKRTRLILKQYPDIGLYVTQISEKIGEDKDKIKEILDTSFWSRKEGSRYFYQDISDEDIINDALFGEEDDFYDAEIESGELDEELVKLLDDPELLIKKLKSAETNIQTGDVQLKKKKNGSGNNASMVSTKSMQRNWEREEVVVLVVAYFQTKNLSAEEIAKSHQMVSELLREREKILSGSPIDDTFRNIAGIRMQSCRIKCLDPETKFNGMQATKLQREVFNEYQVNKKKIEGEAKKIWKKYSH